jgi:hypothetical protein
MYLPICVDLAPKLGQIEGTKQNFHQKFDLRRYGFLSRLYQTQLATNPPARQAWQLERARYLFHDMFRPAAVDT